MSISQFVAVCTLFVGYAVMLFLVFRYIKPIFNYVLRHAPTKSFWVFSMLPAIYYVYAYGATHYNFYEPRSADGMWLRIL